ncbi:MAG: hypothetical protein IGR92_01900 [Leptolyngbyaceae cyanobacterium T60_A2020_046]|nr:hypothetical protein [Leptolyngbyaceae cyanobacterium T60_A2020_046]
MPFPPMHLAWAVTAIGTGLFIETCIDPEGLPEDLYILALKRLLYGAECPNPSTATAP